MTAPGKPRAGARFATAAAMVMFAGCASDPPARYPAGAPFAIDAATIDRAPVKVGGAGPVRVVEVAASWCAGCSMSARPLADLVARHPGSECVVLFVDSDPAAVDRFVARHSVPGRTLMCQARDCVDDFRGWGLPQFFVLDRAGRVVGSSHGYTLTTIAQLEKLFHRAGLRHARPASGGLL